MIKATSTKTVDPYLLLETIIQGAPLHLTPVEISRQTQHCGVNQKESRCKLSSMSICGENDKGGLSLQVFLFCLIHHLLAHFALALFPACMPFFFSLRNHFRDFQTVAKQLGGRAQTKTLKGILVLLECARQ